MRSLTCLTIGSFILFYCVLADFIVTKVRNQVYDTNFAIVDYCYLKAVNRSFKYLSYRIKLLQPPISNAKVNYALLKWSNGYRPFYYNYTVDVCKFFRSRSKNLVHNFIYGIFKDYTNINHSCPFNHDLIVDKFPAYLDNKLDLLPMPRGDYAFDSKWLTDKILRWETRVQFSFT